MLTSSRVDGETEVVSGRGALSVKVTMNSSNRDVELGLDTFGQEVVDGGSLAIGVEDGIVVVAGGFLELLFPEEGVARLPVR